MNAETHIRSTSQPIIAENETKPKRKARLSLDDPYEHAPPKPDGDPWAILLKPEIAADKIRCDAWKDEVQNLLIFAGLFSAVVTTFVIESYKFLQPDPNDTIISLLSQIAKGPNITSSALSTSISPSKAILFAQTSSSIRINTFWFISLILSLATVLVGTIALQWLREHQSYPGLSPKETLAMLHMRTEALEAWCVPQIFTALPLLLQGALVLFLAGLIDFTLPLGLMLTVPVACIVGLILLFLAATTALPAIQPLFLLSGYFSRSAVPTPCAFKSPQSQVFRTLCGFFLRLLSFVFPKIYRTKNQIGVYDNIIPEDSGQFHLFPYIYTIWHRNTWPTFDSEWLSLRDAWHHGILDKDTHLYWHRRGWKDVFPLSDITQCLVNTTTGPTGGKHIEEYLVAACYCFQEISASVWKSEHAIFDFRKDRLNNYFEQIYQQHWPGACSVSTVLIHGGEYQYDAFSVDEDITNTYFRKNETLFLLDQVCLFIDMLMVRRTSIAALERYQLEIKSRVIQHLLMGHIEPLVPGFSINLLYSLPVLYISDAGRQAGFMNLFDSVDLLATTFENVTSDSHKEDGRLMNPVYQNIWVMPTIIDMLAGGIILYLRSLAGTRRDLHTTEPEISNQQNLHNIGNKYSSTFHLAAAHLKEEIASELLTPSLLFELSAMLLQRFLHELQDSELGTDTFSCIKDNSFSQSLAMLLDTVARYQQQMAARSNDPIKIRFKGHNVTRVRKAGETKMFATKRFSNGWWAAFFFDYDNSGLRSINTCTAGPSSSRTSFDIASQPLTSTDEGRPPVITPLSLSAISLHLHSEDITDIAVSSPPASHPDIPHVPSTILGALGQAVEHPAGAEAQLPTPSSHSPSELLVCSNYSPASSTTSCDSIIDIQPSE